MDGRFGNAGFHKRTAEDGRGRRVVSGLGSETLKGSYGVEIS
jgi:hypothetical protein